MIDSEKDMTRIEKLATRLNPTVGFNLAHNYPKRAQSPSGFLYQLACAMWIE